MAHEGSGARVIEIAVCGSRQNIGVQLLNPMRCDVRDPQGGRQTQNKSHNEGLQCAFPMGRARQQEIEPDKARVVGLECEADSKE